MLYRGLVTVPGIHLNTEFCRVSRVFFEVLRVGLSARRVFAGLSEVLAWRFRVWALRI